MTGGRIDLVGTIGGFQGGSAVVSKFACQVCTGVAVILPTLIEDDGLVCCRDCGHEIGTWASFKDAAKTAIFAEAAHRRIEARLLSSDPLPAADPAKLAGVTLGILSV